MSISQQHDNVDYGARCTVPNSRRAGARIGYYTQHEGVGIDTVRLFGEISDYAIPADFLRREIDYLTGEVLSEHRFGGSIRLSDNVLVTIRSRWGKLFACFEQSIPTWLHGHNRVPASLEDLLTFAEETYEQAAHYVDWSCSVNLLSVSRLDLDRDFADVFDAGCLLDGLSRTTCPVKLSERYRRVSGVQTLRRGAQRRWWASAYAKGAQLASIASRERDPARRALLSAQADLARDQLRFEASVRRPVLREHGLKVLGDLTTDKITALGRDSFVRAGFDQPVPGPSHITSTVDSLLADPQWSRSAPAVLGDALIRALGRESPVSRHTRRRYDRAGREHDVTPAMFSAAPTPPMQLDYNLGRLRTA